MEADAEALPFADGEFDCALSAFGVIFVPRPAVAVAELTRVVRPGGRIGIAAWDPDGVNGRIGDAFERALPRPPDLPSPQEWGHEEVLRERLGAEVEIARGAVTWDFPDEDEALAFFERSIPPVAVARATLGSEGWARLRGELADVLREFDHGAGGRLVADAAYVLAVVERA